MKQFRMDNTDGYTEEQLEELNELFNKRVESYELRHECDIDDDERKYISEDVQRHYDYCTECEKRMWESI